MIARLMRMAGIASLLMLAACSSFGKGSASNPIARVLSPSPTQADSAPVVLNAVASAAPAGPVQAPICQASQTCAALDAEQIPISCVKKVPYTNVLVPPGTAFEVAGDSSGFLCLDTGTVVNGKEVLTCHGKELYSFQLRLSNAACSASKLSAGGGQCEDGYGYDAAQKCCAPMGTGASASTIVTVSLGACP